MTTAMTDPNNPNALDYAQDDKEPLEVMEAPPKDFDMFSSVPVSTKVVKHRKLVLQNKDWNSSVHMWIVDVKRKLVLMQKRSPHKDTFPNRWDISSAGHIPAGAKPIDTAQSELAEELGISVDSPDELKFQFICPAEQANDGGWNCYEHVYFLKRDSTVLKCALGTAEVTDVAWVSIDDLKKALNTLDEAYVPRVHNYIPVFFACLDKMVQ
ncbi:unnamed protein product [Cylindrotheca closterium]|uniref:Nudix hydrolase domain-containing protein n=1 Tax=Cylindrotheca closterium TaxID=2856 RepID=A0AAD2FW88_9STRA|nr:unnamed protein product [Cylindrotheca closterium]